MADKTLAELMDLTPEEIDWLERRKTGDLAPRQFMRASELQTRALIYSMPESPERDSLIADSLALRDEVIAVDLETAGMNSLNALNERLVRFHMRVMEATSR